MTQEETIEFERLKTARDSLLLTVADLRGQIETIAAKEREACVLICYGWNNTTSTYIIQEIEARGEA
jgi:hypothetical protein